jgi:hypothetical protein
MCKGVCLTPACIPQIFKKSWSGKGSVTLARQSSANQDSGQLNSAVRWLCVPAGLSATATFAAVSACDWVPRLCHPRAVAVAQHALE